MNTLDQLREHSIVVADTADFHAIELFKPIDATTNPSLILKQAQSPITTGLIEKTQQGLDSGRFKSAADAALDLSVRFGVEIANRIEGYVRPSRTGCKLEHRAGGGCARSCTKVGLCCYE